MSFGYSQDNMNFSCLVVHAQQIEKSRIRRKSRDAKKTKSYEVCSSNGRLDIQDKPRFKKRFYNQVTSKFTKYRVLGCLTLSLKREEVLVHQVRCQLVESVERNIMVIALLGWKIAIGVARAATGLRIVKI